MDVNELARLFRQPGNPLRLRQGVIVSVQSDSTATITIGGDSTQVSGVKVASSCCPVPGASCWMTCDGRDVIVVATLAPAGPAFGTMRQSSAQTIPTGTYTDISFANRTDVTARGITAGSTGLTVVVPGIYRVSAGVGFVASTKGDRYARIMLGATPKASNGGRAPDGAAVTPKLNVSAEFACSIGDVIGLNVYQSDGTSIATLIESDKMYLTATWQGPI